LNFGATVLPPLLTKQAESWIDISGGYYPSCKICCDLSVEVDDDCYVQAAHLMHNSNYYLEMLNAGATDEIRGEDVCIFDYIFLDTASNNSQIWELAVNPGGGEYGVRFLLEEPLIPNSWNPPMLVSGM